MTAEQKLQEFEKNIIGAVETLTCIAELDLQSEVGVAEPHELTILGNRLVYQTVHWLHGEDMNASVDRVKSVFQDILHYLQDFYHEEKDRLSEQKTVENIKEVMVLVGEAAKNLDRFTALRKGRKLTSITELDEYQELQTFYQQNIANQQKGLSVYLDEPTKMSSRGAKISLARHSGMKSLVVELESVKRDLDYELFQIRKENGKTFFNPQLIRNLRLVSDFGEQYVQSPGKDPLLRIEVWRDRNFHENALNILKALSHHMDGFYRNFRQYKGSELASSINKMLMALMLSANPRNLLRNHPVKSCAAYFRDFLDFLRYIVTSPDYKRLIKHPPEKSKTAHWAFLDVTHAACRSLYCVGQGVFQMESAIQGILQKGMEALDEDFPGLGAHQTTDWLSYTYAALQKVLRGHPNGPLRKMLKAVDEGAPSFFDSLHQDNIPNRLYSVFFDNHKVVALRLPSPTFQRNVKKAKVTEEYKGVLRAYARNPVRRKHLLINVQDRTGWKEHQRCLALEELGQDPANKRFLSVVTLPKNTEFYHQRGSYSQLNQAQEFKETFIEQITGERTGFLLPPMVARALTKHWLTQLLDSVHKVFFEDTNVLSRMERLEFIDLTYLFLTVKFVEEVDPTSLSYTCKDGIDSGMASSVMLYLFLSLLGTGEPSENELKKLQVMLYGPALIIRERAPILAFFERMIQCIRRVESCKDHATSSRAFLSMITREFGPLFKTGMLRHATLKAPQPTQSY